MNEKITSLKKKQSNLRMFGTVFLICLILCLLVGMKSQILSAALAVVMLLVYIFVIRTGVKHYRQAVKAATLKESFRPQFKQIPIRQRMVSHPTRSQPPVFSQSLMPKIY